MRQLLTIQSEPGEGGSSPTSRPASAFFITNSRPGSSVATYRPNSSDLLNPRQRPLSATGRPVGFIGPYISDSSRLPSSRSPSPRPPSMAPQPGALSELYDKVAKVADEEEKRREEEEEEEKRKKKKAQEEGKKKGGVGGVSGSGIEEIRYGCVTFPTILWEQEKKVKDIFLRLVKVAASAFKRRRNMKKVKEEQMRRRRKKGSKKFESLVEQIMRIREEEEKAKPPKPKRNQV